MYLRQFFADSDEEIIDCVRCRATAPFEMNFKMAFQPIVDIISGSVFAYEALVRGENGATALDLLASITPENLYIFDQTCRVLAIDTAARLRLKERLSINFLPNAVVEPASCIRLTLAAAQKVGMPIERIILEMSEGEKIRNPEHALRIVKDYQKRGFLTAIDDFGTGYSGLNLLADFQPHLVKLDERLIRNIDRDPARRAIVSGVVNTCEALGCGVIAEGVERPAQLDALREMDINLFQGFLFARPEVMALPEPDLRYI